MKAYNTLPTYLFKEMYKIRNNNSLEFTKGYKKKV